jgi:hypothetical protein
MAYAAAKFTNSLLRALNGEKGVVVPTFVKSPLFESQGIDFFSSNIELGVRLFLLLSNSYSHLPMISPRVLKQSTVLVTSRLRRRSSLKLACLS